MKYKLDICKEEEVQETIIAKIVENASNVNTEVGVSTEQTDHEIFNPTFCFLEL